MIPCTCTAGGGGETVLPRPDWLPDGERMNGVPVDPCIATTIQWLWAAGIHTLGSCCGHNKRPPSLVLTAGRLLDGEVQWIHRTIAEVDDRTWTLHQWQLVELAGPGPSEAEMAAEAQATWDRLMPPRPAPLVPDEAMKFSTLWGCAIVGPEWETLADRGTQSTVQVRRWALRWTWRTRAALDFGSFGVLEHTGTALTRQRAVSAARSAEGDLIARRADLRFADRKAGLEPHMIVMDEMAPMPEHPDLVVVADGLVHSPAGCSVVDGIVMVRPSAAVKGYTPCPVCRP